jgi:YggT family protein
MIFLSNFLEAAAIVIRWVLQIYMWVIIARAILSWVSPDPYNPIVRFIHNITEPVLYQVRKRIPALMGGIDFSPIIVLLAILFLQHFVVQSLLDWAAKLG